MTMRPVKHAIDSNCYLAETPNLSVFYTAHDVDVRVSLVKDGYNAHNAYEWTIDRNGSLNQVRA